MTRWYYDIQVGTCLKFTYGGCGNSNSNMFVSRAECLSVCGNGNFTFPNLLGGEWFVPPDKGRSKEGILCLSALHVCMLICKSNEMQENE